MTNILELIKIECLAMSQECPQHLYNVALTFHVECYPSVILPGGSKKCQIFNIGCSDEGCKTWRGGKWGQKKNWRLRQGRDENNDIIGKGCKTQSGKRLYLCRKAGSTWVEIFTTFGTKSRKLSFLWSRYIFFQFYNKAAVFLEDWGLRTKG